MELVQVFEDKAPEIVFEWHDAETGAQAWLVINSLRGGAAGGGTRMRDGLTRDEVISLAKTMEIKFTVSGPEIGGAKTGINFNPRDPRRREVLERWYRVAAPILKNYYGTGGDMNVDEIEDVIPITEDYGIWHPQEGIVNGHYKPTEKEKIRKIGQLRVGVSKIIEDPDFTPSRPKKITISDMITGYGVAASIWHYYKLWHHANPSGKRALIQGWGNVGAAAGFFLAKMGVKVVGIIDISGGVFSEQGFSLAEITELFLHREDRRLTSPALLPFQEADAKFWNTKADIMIPAAGSRLIDQHHIDLMLQNGIEVISCGANVPFKEQAVFYGSLLQQADSKMHVIPDFIANCGMARVFAYLMHRDIDITDDAIFNDVSTTIEKALKEVYANGGKDSFISKTALEIAIKKLI
jgi:glutamate dehydrogenase/leucine dehydrogenase